MTSLAGRAVLCGIALASVRLPAQAPTAHVLTRIDRAVLQDSAASITVAPIARLHADAAAYLGSANPLANGTVFRRARLGVEASIATDWEAEFEIDFAGGGTEIKDAWVAFTGWRRTVLRAGNFKEPFGLETMTSSADISLLERAYPVALAPDRAIGVAITHWAGPWHVSAGVFGEPAGTPGGDGRDEGRAFAARSTYALHRTPNSFLQLGASVARRTPNAADSGTMRFSSRAETSVSDARFLDTGDLADVRSAVRFNGEALLIAGPLSVQGEYTRAMVHRSADAAADLEGGYVMVSFFATGETRQYLIDEGEPDTIVPRRTSGAWELLARASSLDLNDVQGGIATNVTAGLTWYANRHVKWMMNYSLVRNGRFARPDIGPAAVPRDSFSIVQTRIALDF